MNSERRAKMPVGISIDMDNQWSYMKTHGDTGWQNYPTYFDVLVPTLLKLLDELDLSITFFLVGADVLDARNHDAVRMIAESGHEAGNHSLSHEPWLHLYSRDEIRAEVDRTHEAITKVHGMPPRGFRGPGFSWSRDLLEILADANYEYDASSLPTFIGPLARMYYFRTSELSTEEREMRGRLFGSVSDGFQPLRPHRIGLPSGRSMLEIPVTTIPLFRTPFHLSYLVYLSRFSVQLMQRYLQVAMMMCRLFGTPISFLLHPLDILGGDQVPSLRFFPGMDVDGTEKRELFRRVLDVLARHFRPMSMSALAESIGEREVPVTVRHQHS